MTALQPLAPLPDAPVTDDASRTGHLPVRSRITGIDMARALAILGMVMVHFGPLQADVDTTASMLYRFSYGRASVLFVLLAGVGISMLFRTRSREQAWLQIGWRALVFFPLGALLQSLDTGVAVILQFYAAYYLVGGLAAMIPTRFLASLSVIWIVAGPLLFLTIADPSLAGRGTATTLSSPSMIIGDLAINGFYPLITWSPPLLVGILIGRADLRDAVTRAVLAVGGLTLAALTYGGGELARRVGFLQAATSDLLLSEGHTGAPLNVIGATAVAVAVLGACLLLASALPRLTWPIAATGQLAFTVYVGHLFLLALAPGLLEGRASYGDAVVKVSRFYLVVIVFCTLWRLKLRRGPLEWLLGLPFATRQLTSTPGGDAWLGQVQAPGSSTTAPKPSPQSMVTYVSPHGTPPPPR